VNESCLFRFQIRELHDKHNCIPKIAQYNCVDISIQLDNLEKNDNELYYKYDYPNVYVFHSMQKKNMCCIRIHSNLCNVFMYPNALVFPIGQSIKNNKYLNVYVFHCVQHSNTIICV